MGNSGRTLYGLVMLGGFSAATVYFIRTMNKEADVQAMLFSTRERKRWRESTLWGETPEEEYYGYKLGSAAPGRSDTLFYPESEHYEPAPLVANGIRYRPLDRATTSTDTFKV